MGINGLKELPDVKTAGAAVIYVGAVGGNETTRLRWVKFMQEHGEQLKAGQQFKRDDPAITPDLFPTMKFGL